MASVLSDTTVVPFKAMVIVFPEIGVSLKGPSFLCFSVAVMVTLSDQVSSGLAFTLMVVGTRVTVIVFFEDVIDLYTVSPENDAVTSKLTTRSHRERVGIVPAGVRRGGLGEAPDLDGDGLVGVARAAESECVQVLLQRPGDLHGLQTYGLESSRPMLREVAFFSIVSVSSSAAYS